MTIAYTAKDVLKIVKEKNVSFIQFWFTDVLGILKSFAITPGSWKRASRRGWVSTAPPSRASARIEESDMIAMPDPTTFQFIPWRPLATGRSRGCSATS